MKRIILICLLWMIANLATAVLPEHFEQRLAKGSLTEKQQLISDMIKENNATIQPLFNALVEGNLYWLETNSTLVIKKDNQFVNWNNKQVLDVPKNKFKRIAINNNIRQLIAEYQLQMKLSSNTIPTRRIAAKELFGHIQSPSQMNFIVERLAQEQDSEVKQRLLEALSFAKLTNCDENECLVLLTQLSQVTNPIFVQKLQQLTTTNDSQIVKDTAQNLLDKLTQKKAMYEKTEQVYFGISLGAVLVLAAIGLAITFGVMGVINMAHGELIMIGAYTTYVMQQLLPNCPGIALILSIPAAFLVCGAVGMLIEISVIRYLYGRPLETLLATFGISLLLQQLFRTIFSPLNKAIITPSWMQGSIQVNDFLSLTINRLYVIGFSLTIFIILLLIMKKTALGLNVRAISINPLMARCLGVKASWVNALTFGLGSGIAGLAGVALSQITNVGPNLGQNYIIDSFMVVVFGGVGNLWGTLIAGLILGLANKFLEPITGAMLAKIVVLISLVLFIQKRPRGLFPQRGRAVEG